MNIQRPKIAISTDWDSTTEGWDAHAPALQAWLARPTETMIAAVGIEKGSRVLDVAAGGGHQTLAVARAVGAGGHVLCTDLSSALIESLHASAERSGLTMIEARVADGQDPLPEEDVFDTAICRLGLMLMPEPERCLRSIRSALRSGGRFAAMVFAGPEENPCIRVLMATALRHAGLPMRDPYLPGGLLSLGRSGHMDRLFAAEGFSAISTLRIDAPFRLRSVDDYIAFLRTAAAPVCAILAPLAPAAREAAWQDMREQLSTFQQEDQWVGPNTLLLTVGRK